jgi:hypothetical protein
VDRKKKVEIPELTFWKNWSMVIEKELHYLRIEDQHNKLYQNNNLIVTKRDNLVTDEHEAYYSHQDKQSKLSVRPQKIMKQILWKIMIYIDVLEEAPKSVLSRNAVHFLHLKYVNR